MNMNDLIGGLNGGVPHIGGPKIDPRDYPTIKCSKCGGMVFHGGMVLKKIAGTMLGAGGEDIAYPLQVLVCDKCGAILDDDVKAYKLEKDLGIETSTETKKEESKTTSSSLIL